MRNVAFANMSQNNFCHTNKSFDAMYRVYRLQLLKFIFRFNIKQGPFASRRSEEKSCVAMLIMNYFGAL